MISRFQILPFLLNKFKQSALQPVGLGQANRWDFAPEIRRDTPVLT
jgi:hypothetical protein